MARIRVEDFVPKVKKALDTTMAQYLIQTQGELASQQPVDTGRMASSWFIQQSQPNLATRPEDWAEPGAARVELDTPSENSIKFDGTWYLSNNVDYAERVATDARWAKGGAGGVNWFRKVETRQATVFNKFARKNLRGL